METIGVICALKWEVPDIIQAKKDKQITLHTIGNHTIHSIVSGPGQKNASSAVEKLCQQCTIDYLLCIGVAGCTKKVPIGTQLVAKSVIYDGHEIPLDSDRMQETKEKLIKNGSDFETGKFQTFNHPVMSRKHVLEEVLAVDMESYGIARKAQDKGVRFEESFLFESFTYDVSFNVVFVLVDSDDILDRLSFGLQLEFYLEYKLHSMIKAMGIVRRIQYEEKPKEKKVLLLRS